MTLMSFVQLRRMKRAHDGSQVTKVIQSFLLQMEVIVNETYIANVHHLVVYECNDGVVSLCYVLKIPGAQLAFQH